MMKTVWKRALGGLALLWMLPLYAAAEEGVKVEITAPAPQAPAHGLLTVQARIASDYDLKQVQASVEDRTAVLVKSCSWNAGCLWTGELQLAGLSRGTQELVVTAVDHKNRTGRASLHFQHNEPPVIEVSEPASGGLVPADLHVRAQASDDGGVPGLAVSIGSKVLFEGTGALDQSFDVSEYAGQQVELTFTAKDNEGITTVRTIPLFVDAGDAAALLDQVAGRILDFDDKRTLYLTTDQQLRVKNRLSGTDEQIAALNPDGSHVPSAALISNGAVYSDTVYDGEFNWVHLYLWKNGQVSLLSEMNWSSSSVPSIVLTSGDRLIYRDSDGYSQLLNTKTGHELSLGYIYSAHAAPDGTLILAGGGVYSYRAGAQPVLLNDDPRNEMYAKPFTDGSRFLYTAVNFSDDFGRPTYNTLILHENGQKLELVRKVNEEITDYALNSGWVVYQKPANGISQLHLRSPQGQETQLTYYSSGAALFHLESDGTVYYTYKNQLYAQAPGDEEPRLLGPAPAEGLIREGDRWYRVSGNQLYQAGLGLEEDRSAPVWPAAEALSVTQVTYHSAELSWLPAADERGVASYEIYQDASLLARVWGDRQTYSAAGLHPAQEYRFEVRARDAAGNVSISNPAVSVTTEAYSPADTTAPVWPSGEILHAAETAYDRVLLSWQQAADDKGVNGYRLYQDSRLIADVTGTTYQVTGLKAEAAYVFQVTAYDAAGNMSLPAPPLSVTTAAYHPHPSQMPLQLTLKPGFHEVGSTVEVSVKGADVEELYAFLLRIGYDPAKLRLNQMLLSKDFGIEGQSAVFAKNTSTPGLLRLSGSLLGAETGKSGNPGTAVLKFTILQTGSSELVLQPGSAVADSKGQVKELEAAIRLEIPTVSVDFNGDGEVGLADLAIISKLSGRAAGQAGYESRFDLNQDGRIDLTDIQYTANKVTAAGQLAVENLQ